MAHISGHGRPQALLFPEAVDNHVGPGNPVRFMAACLKARPEVLNRRRESVEHPSGSIKQWMGQGAFLVRGPQNVRAEFSLTAPAYNMRRVISLLGARAMIAALHG